MYIMKCTALPTACRSASSLACLFAVMCRAAVLPCCRVGLRHRRVVRSRPSHLSGISLFALITHQVGPDLMCLCLFPPRHFLFPRGSGEFGHGQGTTGPGAPAKMRRWTSQAETMHLSVRWRGTVAGRARRGWVASQSLGTGEQGAPAGPPKRRPARKSLLIPCVAKTLAVFWGMEPDDWWEAEDLPGGAGPLAGAMRTQRERALLGYNICGQNGWRWTDFWEIRLVADRPEGGEKPVVLPARTTDARARRNPKQSSERGRELLWYFLDGARHMPPFRLPARIIEVSIFLTHVVPCFFLISHSHFVSCRFQSPATLRQAQPPTIDFDLAIYEFACSHSDLDLL